MALQDFNSLIEHPAFKDFMGWFEHFADAHLAAEPPNKVLPNYGEIYAAQAAQYRMVRDVKKYLDKRTTNKL